jgi:hypothetical protein
MHNTEISEDIHVIYLHGLVFFFPSIYSSKGVDVDIATENCIAVYVGVTMILTVTLAVAMTVTGWHLHQY